MTSPSTSSPSRFPVTPSTASTTPIPGSRSSTGSPTCSSRRIRWCTGDRCCTPSDRRSAWASTPGGLRGGRREPPAGFSTPSRVPDDQERLLRKRTVHALPELQPTGTAAQSGHGGQALGLVTERDERTKNPYVTTAPDRRFRTGGGLAGVSRPSAQI